MGHAPQADILVTGATGLLGSAVVRRLGALPGVRTVATWRRTPPPVNLQVAWEAVDLADDAAAARLLARLRPHAVLHAAVPAREADYAAGIVGASAALAAAA